jgi:hypothetical protein
LSSPTSLRLSRRRIFWQRLFERGGYRVTRLGIEELFGEIKHLDVEQYHALALRELK